MADWVSESLRVSKQVYDNLPGPDRERLKGREVDDGNGKVDVEISLTSISLADLREVLVSNTPVIAGYVTKPGENEGPIDVAGKHFVGCAFERVLFTRFDARAAQFEFCRSSNANFRSANLHNTNFRFCEFNNITFGGGCELNETYFTSCRFLLTTFLEGTAGGRQSVHFGDASFSMSQFRNCDIARAEFFECRIKGTNFRDCGLTGTQFTGGTLVDCEFTNVSVSSTTSFKGLDSAKGTSIHSHTLAALADFGGLSTGQRMDMNIQNAVATLRESFSGFWTWAHTIALVLFVFPYVAFLAEQYWIARTVRPVPTPSETILEALGWYLWSAGTGHRFSPMFFVFLGQLIYNVARAWLLFQTKSLELKEHITGLPVRFEIAGWWRRLYLAVTWGFYGNVLLVLLHLWHFLQQRVPHWAP